MIYFISGGQEISAHLGESRPKSVYIPNIQQVQADGDELQEILISIEGISVGSVIRRNSSLITSSTMPMRRDQ